MRPSRLAALAAMLVSHGSCNVSPSGGDPDLVRLAAEAPRDPHAFPGLPDFPPVEKPTDFDKAVQDALKGAKDAIVGKVKDFLVGKAVDAALELLGLKDKPVDVKAEFAAVKAKIEELGDTVVFVDWRDRREDRLNQMQSALDDVREVARGGTIDFATLTPGDIDKLTAANGKSRDSARSSWNDDSAFQRFFRAELTAGDWTTFLPQPPVDHGLVLDWRWGMGEMVRLVSVRVDVLHASQVDSRTNPAFRQELEEHRVGVGRRLENALGSVQCHTDWFDPVTVLCADIESGQEIHFRFSGASCFPVGGRPTAECEAIARAYTSEAHASINATLPVFQTRALMHQLAFLRDPRPDLTSQQRQVQFGNGLCLTDVEITDDEGNPLDPVPGAFPCDGSSSQLWDYDRNTSSVRDDAGRCLTMAEPAPRFASRDDYSPLVGYLSLQTCNGSWSQQWTWDPDSQHLYTRYDTVLTARTFVRGPGFPVPFHGFVTGVPDETVR
jgi:hypothetical protein